MVASSNEAITCPQCDGPREAKALYCAFCGAIFNRLEATPADPAAREADSEDAPAGHRPEPGTVAPPDRETRDEDSVDDTDGSFVADQIYQGPQAPEDDFGASSLGRASAIGPSAGALGDPGGYGETLLTRNLLLSLLVTALLFGMVYSFFAKHIFSADDDLDAVRTAFLTEVGVSAPESLDDGVLLRFVGHNLIMIDAPDQQVDGEMPVLVATYRQGRIAGGADGEELKRIAKRHIDSLGIPVYPISSTTSELAGRPASVETMGIGSREQPFGRIVYWDVTNRDNQPVLLVLMGPQRDVAEIKRRYFR